MKKILKFLIRLTAVVVVFVLLILVGFTILEYRPATIEEVNVSHNPQVTMQVNQEYSALTFNIGYAGLGKDEDFVLDGGKKSMPNSKEVVEGYFGGIKSILEENEVNFYLLQEVDKDSRRSFNINEVQALKTLKNNYAATFAYNYKAEFVPFPFSFTDYLGKVESGIMTMASFNVKSAERFQLPSAFAWPIRTVNLKRAMKVLRIPLEGSDKEFVLVNLHLSAYDSDGSMRNQEMEFLKTFLINEKDAGNYVLVGGDFNQTFPNAKDIYPVKQDYYVAYPIEDSFIPTGYTFKNDITKPTCRLLNQPYDKTDPNTQYYIIDGFIASDNIQVNTVYTLDYDFAFSDHNPVKVSFKLI